MDVSVWFIAVILVETLIMGVVCVDIGVKRR